MSYRSGDAKFPFDLLAGETSGDDIARRRRNLSSDELDADLFPHRKRKSKTSKKRKKKVLETSVSDDLTFLLRSHNQSSNSTVENHRHLDNGLDVRVLESRSVVETVCESRVVEESSQLSSVTLVELRQRNVGGGGSFSEEPGEEASSRIESLGGRQTEGNGIKLGKEESLDWSKVIAENPDLLADVSSASKSPFNYFMGEIYGGSPLRSTLSAGNEKKRQGVYNTMFHVPWRCERLIIAGFFVCLDSFLSLLTIMPARIFLAVWRLLKKRQFLRPNAAELSDIGLFFVLVFGISSLQLVDISLIYHVIRGQATVKLYVVYNVLEIFDKLCQSFEEDVVQVLFDSAESLSNCPKENTMFELSKFLFDEAIAIIAFIIHSFILLAQAITLSTCIVAHNNALLALLVSNNFSEIKSNVFKRVSKENLHNLVYFDIVERFHITAFVLFVLAQNILEAEGSWFESFSSNVFQVYLCEVLVDSIKHSFLAKFNEIKPIAYSEFLEDLCKQVLNEKPDERRKDLTFIPLAPACVVIRVLASLYAALLPCGPFLWRLFWILLWSGLTYIMLTICKILVGLTLRHLATWYINLRVQKEHVD